MASHHPVQEPPETPPPFADRLKGWAVENPMKIYGTVFVAADSLYFLQGYEQGSLLWMGGTTLGVVANTNKILRGMGGETFDLGKDFFTPADLGRFALNSVQSAAHTLTPRFWQDVLAAPTLSGQALKNQFAGAMRFNPLDAGWVLTGTAGAMYIADGFTRAEGIEAMPIVVGTAVLAGSAVGFLKNRPDMAGRIFTVATWSVLGFSVLNPEQLGFALASLPFYLAANYLVTKVRPANQLGVKPDVDVSPPPP